VESEITAGITGTQGAFITQDTDKKLLFKYFIAPYFITP